MPITQKQREQRRKHLGGSDIPILFGLNRFRNPHDLYLDKTGKLEDKPLDSEAAMAGTLFEDGVIQYAEQTLGQIKRNQYRSADGLPIATNIDGIVMATQEPVEIKVEGLFWKLRDGWGDEGTDNTPYDVIVQAHAHMICQKSDVCYVAAFLGGVGFRLYRIEKDDELVEIIIKKATAFWNDNVLADVPPEDVPSIESIKNIVREEGESIEINNVLVDCWLELEAAAKGAKTKADAAKNTMLAAMGTAEIATCELGTVTYKSQLRKSIDSKALKAEMPEVAAKYMKESSYRVARFKKT